MQSLSSTLTVAQPSPNINHQQMCRQPLHHIPHVEKTTPHGETQFSSREEPSIETTQTSHMESTNSSINIPQSSPTRESSNSSPRGSSSSPPRGSSDSPPRGSSISPVDTSIPFRRRCLNESQTPQAGDQIPPRETLSSSAEKPQPKTSKDSHIRTEFPFRRRCLTEPPDSHRGKQRSPKKQTKTFPRETSFPDSVVKKTDVPFRRRNLVDSKFSNTDHMNSRSIETDFSHKQTYAQPVGTNPLRKDSKLRQTGTCQDTQISPRETKTTKSESNKGAKYSHRGRKKSRGESKQSHSGSKHSNREAKLLHRESQDLDNGDEVVFERRPSVYLLLEPETILLFRLAGMKLKPAQQERLYWNLLRLLNSLENEEKEMTTSYNHGYEAKKDIKRNDTFDGGGYGIFWDEYHSIEQSHPPSSSISSATSNTTGTGGSIPPDSEDGMSSDKSEREIQWLNDVGFTNIAKKIRARHEIDQNDDELKIIAASLTRAQANAVRRRIDSLNEAIRQRNVTEPKKLPSYRASSTKQRRHVKDIFQGSKQSGKKLLKDGSWIKRNDPGDNGTQDTDDLNDGQPPVVPPKPRTKRHKHKKYNDEPSFDIEDENISNGQISHHPPLDDPSTRVETPSQRPSEDTTPQHDNLVRRTSANNLIIMSGEEREKSFSSSMERLNDSLTNVESNESHNLKPHKNSSIKKRETFDSAYLRRPSQEYSNNKNHLSAHDADSAKVRRRHSDAPIGSRGNQEKRLVVVDSTYINVSTVGDGYTSKLITPSVKSGKNGPPYRERSSESESSITKYKTDHDSLKPFESSSLDAALPQNVSSEPSLNIVHNTPEASSDSLKIEQLPKSISNLSLRSSNSSIPSSLSEEHLPSIHTDDLSPSTENSPTVTDGSALSNKREKKHKHKHHHKEKKKHKHRKHHRNEKDDPVLDILAQETTSFETTTTTTTSTPTSLKMTVSPTLTTHSSDDNKSIDSMESLGSQENFNDSKYLYNTKPKTVNYSSSDSNRTTPEKSLDSHLGSMSDFSTTPRTQSPQYLEGDAKLNVGAASSPRVPPERSPPQEAALNTGPTFPKLPNFTLTKEELGLTHIGDLSEPDMSITRRLALIELTALFDQSGVPIKTRRKPNVKLKLKDNGTFGVPLITLCSREESKHNPNVKVPKILLQLIGYLERHGLHEEGLLRVPGSAHRVKLIREEADKNPDLSTLEWEGRKMTDIATCFKQFLRDLPEPLLTYEYQNTFTSVAEIPDRKVQLQALNLLVVLLPPVHQECLKKLLVFLNKVIANESSNKMGLNNVAMIMAPNLFFQNNAKINKNEAKKAAGMTDVLRMLIKYQLIVWTIPSFMVSQIRFLNEAGAKTKDPKALSKIIKRRRLDSPSHLLNPAIKMTRPGGGGGSSGDELEDFDESLIIRVRAPTLNKQSMAIQLSTQTTVAEVVSKFQWQRQKSNKEKDEIDTSRLRIKPRQDNELALVDLYLYEVGGNIGERRLDSSACISAILRENPNAEWVLKSEIRR